MCNSILLCKLDFDYLSYYVYIGFVVNLIFTYEIKKNHNVETKQKIPKIDLADKKVEST